MKRPPVGKPIGEPPMLAELIKIRKATTFLARFVFWSAFIGFIVFIFAANS